MGILTGALINGAGIVLGSVIGVVWGRHMNAGFRRQVPYLLGLVIVLVGVKMAWAMPDPVNLLVSVIGGTWMGTALRIDDRLATTRRARSSETGAITAILLFNVGAMAILGAFQAGLAGRDTILSAKAGLDGVTAALLASVSGWPVMLAAPVTTVYEAILTVLAGRLHAIMTPPLVADLETVGGVMIMGIGLNFINGRPLIKLGDMLPALLVSPLLAWLELGGWHI